jgi:hypothetical protein
LSIERLLRIEEVITMNKLWKRSAIVLACIVLATAIIWAGYYLLLIFFVKIVMND